MRIWLSSRGSLSIKGLVKWLWVTRSPWAVWFAPEPTFCAWWMGCISQAEKPSVNFCPCPQMPLFQLEGITDDMYQPGTTLRLLSGHEGRKGPHLEMWRSHCGSGQTWGKSWNRMSRHGNIVGSVWGGGDIIGYKVILSYTVPLYSKFKTSLGSCLSIHLSHFTTAKHVETFLWRPVEHWVKHKRLQCLWLQDCRATVSK